MSEAAKKMLERDGLGWIPEQIEPLIRDARGQVGVTDIVILGKANREGNKIECAIVDRVSLRDSFAAECPEEAQAVLEVLREPSDHDRILVIVVHYDVVYWWFEKQEKNLKIN